MPQSRVSILSHSGTSCPYFVVNRAAVGGYVEIQQDLTLKGRLYSELGYTFLDRGDSFVLLSFGLFVPYGFELMPIEQPMGAGYQPNLANFRYIDADVLKDIPENYLLSYPMGANYELNHGTFFDFPKDSVLIGDTAYELSIIVTEPNPRVLPLRVSMYSVPADLDGKTFRVPFFIKIAHTNPMIASAP